MNGVEKCILVSRVDCVQREKLRPKEICDILSKVNLSWVEVP